MTYYDLNMNSKRLNNTQDPSANQDAATKNYVDKFATNTPYYYPNQVRGGRADGIIASNYDAAQARNFIDYQQGINANCPLFYSVYLKEGTVVTRGLFFVSSAGEDVSAYFGIYNKSGVLVAVSNLTAISPTTNTMKELNLTSTYTVPTTDFYYLAIMLTSIVGIAAYPTVPQAGVSGAAAIAAQANLINFPQTAQEVNTGNLSVFRSAITTVPPSGTLPLQLPANLNTFTLTNLANQYWIGIS